jgi:hypothetical protein
MQNINRLVILGVTMAVVGFVAGVIPASAQTKEARGNVTAVTETTMTVKAGAQNSPSISTGRPISRCVHRRRSATGGTTRQRRLGSTISSRPAFRSL